MCERNMVLLRNCSLHLNIRELALVGSDQCNISFRLLKVNGNTYQMAAQRVMKFTLEQYALHCEKGPCSIRNFFNGIMRLANSQL